MFFDFDETEPRDRYKLATATIVPRPIAWVVTRGTDGADNAAPFSFFNVLSQDPMLVALGCSEREGGKAKDTVAHIRESGQFVVCLVDEERLAAMNVTAIDFPPGESEIAAAGLTTQPSVKVAPPRIAEIPVALECEVFQTVMAGRQTIFLGKVLAMHVRDDCMLDPARHHVDTARLKLVGRMGGGGSYVRLHDRLEVPRLTLPEFRRGQVRGS